MSTERMPNPAFLIPEAIQGLIAVNRAVLRAGLDSKLLALSHLRASQINSSSPCVSGGAETARRSGPAPSRSTPSPHGVRSLGSAMRYAPRSPLAEAVTRLADSPVPDEVWDRAAMYSDRKELAALLLNIAITNAFNRLNVPTRHQATRATA